MSSATSSPTALPSSAYETIEELRKAALAQGHRCLMFISEQDYADDPARPRRTCERAVLSLKRGRFRDVDCVLDAEAFIDWVGNAILRENSDNRLRAGDLEEVDGEIRYVTGAEITPKSARLSRARDELYIWLELAVALFNREPGNGI